MAAPDGQLRASDTERERIIELLRRHTADGRLTLEEFEQRVGEALAATTRADLGPVLRDLPPLQPVPPHATRPTPVRVRWPSALDGGAVLRTVAVVAAVTVVLASGWQLWWIVFPLIAVFGGCGRSATSCTSGRSRWADNHRHGGRVAAHDRSHRGRVADDQRETIRV
ncbi:MAG TPA: DUF1707 domain-containing protein [Euzebyales bacterium]|nr:DUF1707 domain-containing protein [Euzebyales bacterium]